ncbi:MAG: hypothetical protein QW153_04200 [Candidatus Bilamarchaeaceae archaeon]
MVELSARVHPDVLFAYSQNFVNLIIRVENHDPSLFWCEIDIKVPESLSLSPTSDLQKGRVRVGILTKKEFIEKLVKIFANQYTPPQIYPIFITLYLFNKDGVIESRLEKKIEIRCEVKKEETL